MSANSYPSPVSSPTLSPIGELSTIHSDVQSPTPSTGTVVIPIDEHSESQSPTLRQLEQRVRDLRRNILEENLRAVQIQEPSSSGSGISPGHEAIVLTGQLEEPSRIEQAAWNRLNSILPPAAMERLRQFESHRHYEPDRLHQYLRMATANLNPLDTATTQVTPSSSHPTVSSQSSSLLNSPLSPPRQRLLPPRTLQDTQPLRIRELSDDPNTLLGRRVIAREASGDSNTSYNRSNVHTTEHEFIRNLARQRRSEPAFQRQIQSSLDAMRRDVEAFTSRSFDSVANLVSAGAPIRGHMRRALRTSRIDVRQSSSNTASSVPSPRDRLSILSNLSVQNLPTPSSSFSQPVMLFSEEPTSYISSQAPLEDGRLVSSTSGEAQGRSYITTRRLNAEGDEYVHTINPVTWDDIPFASSPIQLQHALTRREISREHRRDNTVQVSDHVLPATPLGVVLDRDGNEILPEEHQNLPLPDARLATFSRAPLLFEELPPPPLHITDDRLETVTLSSPDDDLNSGSDLPPRVRINPRESGSSEDMTGPFGIIGKPNAQWMGSNKPVFIDPLPVPVEVMILEPNVKGKKTRRPPIRVHKNANFAGR